MDLFRVCFLSEPPAHAAADWVSRSLAAIAEAAGPEPETERTGACVHDRKNLLFGIEGDREDISDAILRLAGMPDIRNVTLVEATAARQRPFVCRIQNMRDCLEGPRSTSPGIDLRGISIGEALTLLHDDVGRRR